MFLKRIEIDNYKSLKGVVVEPTPLMALVGPNAAGKTNFCEALDFLSRVYEWNLERAVTAKGGYENICYRDGEGLSRDPIRFGMVVEQMLLVPLGKITVQVGWEHAFEFERDQPASSLLVTMEDLTYRGPQGSVHLKRKGDHFQTVELSRVEMSGEMDASLAAAILGMALPRGELILPPYSAVVLGNLPAPRMVGLRVFQLSALAARSMGSPIPDPNLERFGGNLPAVILHLKRYYPEAYDQILVSLQRVLPGVEGLEVTQARTLALSLQQGGHSWPVEDLSDGTLQAISTLAAAFDPRISVLVLEEPENHVHPWALRGFAEAFREASKTKQIILTTHSPILLDQLKPEEIWIVQKPGSVTKIDPLLTLDPSLKESWEGGHFTLSEYLDSGALPEAVPAAAP
ncbi:MAG TPA: AAA family ATPase [Thermoanaerobaculia bacterium]|jgi:predicted ATPase|nr:AAA family ATPase [Thermoanaerobaculia bacterium]